jgi:hypothetical protein
MPMWVWRPLGSLDDGPRPASATVCGRPWVTPARPRAPHAPRTRPGSAPRTTVLNTNVKTQSAHLRSVGEKAVVRNRHPARRQCAHSGHSSDPRRTGNIDLKRMFRVLGIDRPPPAQKRKSRVSCESFSLLRIFASICRAISTKALVAARAWRTCPIMYAGRRYPRSRPDATFQWLDWLKALARGRTESERTP